MSPERERRRRMLEHLARLHEMLRTRGSEIVGDGITHAVVTVCDCQLAHDYQDALMEEVADADAALARMRLLSSAAQQGHGLTLKLQSVRRGADTVVTKLLMAWDLAPLESVGVIVTDVGQWQLFGAALLLASRAMTGHLTVQTEGDAAVVGEDERVTEQEWNAAREGERENSTHPCDHHDPLVYMCAGACSCHWKKR